jgi:hypothetical protein
MVSGGAPDTICESGVLSGVIVFLWRKTGILCLLVLFLSRD